MKKAILAIWLAAAFAWFMAACSPSSSPMSPAATPVPGTATASPTPCPACSPTVTPTYTPIVVTNSGSTFSPSSLNVNSGTSVTFNLSAGHTVHIDDGTGSSVCGPDNFTSFPTNRVFSGTSGTIYRIHCDNHSCGTSCLLGCTGMVMTVTIN